MGCRGLGPELWWFGFPVRRRAGRGMTIPTGRSVQQPLPHAAELLLFSRYLFKRMLMRLVSKPVSIPHRTALHATPRHSKRADGELSPPHQHRYEALQPRITDSESDQESKAKAWPSYAKIHGGAAPL